MTYFIKTALLLLLSVASTTISHSIQDQFASVGFYQVNWDCFNSGESSSIDYCSSEDLVGGSFVKLNACQAFLGFWAILENINDEFNLTSYQDSQCTQYFNSFLITSTDCTNFCGQSPFKISSNIIKSNDIQIPKSSFTTIVYPGQCDGNWEQSFLSVEYTFLNVCASTGGEFNYIYSCNSTSQVIQQESTTDNCSDNVSKTIISSTCNNINSGHNNQVICNE